MIRAFIGQLVATYVLRCLSLGVVSAERLAELEGNVRNGIVTDGSRTAHRWFAKWITDLTDEERATVIPIIQRHRDQIDEVWRTQIDEWDGVLGYLGSEEAVGHNISRWREFKMPGQLTVVRAATGRLPIYLEPELFLEEAHEWLGDAFQVKTSFMVTSVLLDYLHYNKHYSQEVRDWAGRSGRIMQKLDDLTPARTVVRGWFRANEAFIRAGRFENIVPGDELPAVAAQGENPGMRTIPLKGRGQDLTPTPSSDPKTFPPASRIDPHPSGGAATWAIIAVILAAILALYKWRFSARK